MKHPYTRTMDLDLSGVDMWAIGLVVNEGVKMNLSYEEQIVAVREMSKRKLSQDEMAHRLRVTLPDVEALKQRVVRLKQRQRVS